MKEKSETVLDELDPDIPGYEQLLQDYAQQCPHAVACTNCGEIGLLKTENDAHLVAQWHQCPQTPDAATTTS